MLHLQRQDCTEGCGSEGLEGFQPRDLSSPLQKSSISSFEKAEHFTGCFRKISGPSQFFKMALGDDYTPLFLTMNLVLLNSILCMAQTVVKCTGFWLSSPGFESRLCYF